MTNSDTRVRKATTIPDNMPPENRCRTLLDEDSAGLLVRSDTGKSPLVDQIEAKVPCNNEETKVPLTPYE